MTKNGYLMRVFEEASNATRSQSVSPIKDLPNNNTNNANYSNNSNVNRNNTNTNTTRYDTNVNTNNNNKYDNSVVRPVPVKFDNGYNTSHPIRYDDNHASSVIFNDNYTRNSNVRYDDPVRYLDNLTFYFDQINNQNNINNPNTNYNNVSTQNIRFNEYVTPPINPQSVLRYDDAYKSYDNRNVNPTAIHTIPTYTEVNNNAALYNPTSSRIQETILNAKVPVPVSESSTISLKVNGPQGLNEIRGIWVNKDECLNWRGPIPLDQYKINLNTTDATVIRKHANHTYDQVQNISVKYLKPSRAQPPGDLIIREEPDVQLPPAPPIIIRQQAAVLKQPAPKVFRERPPRQPANVPTQTISIPGKTLEPPQRQIIVERMAAEVQKPQDLIIERWLGFPKQKRNVVHKRAQSQVSTQPAPRNVIIDWETTGHVGRVEQKMNFLGVETADPAEYERRHGNELVTSDRLPSDIVNKLQVPNGEYLAANNNFDLNEFILTGDVNALKLVDRNRNDLNQYLSHKF